MEQQPELQISPDCEVRGHDAHGSGHYGASRGARTHRGVDFVCDGGTLIRSPVDGVITRCKGVVYSDPKKAGWHYVEVKDNEGMKNRFFYVKALDIELGLKIKKGDIIGVAQGIECLYEGITPHIHYETRMGKTMYFDPIVYLRGRP